ncbi:MAG TPA: hypothetical protein VKU92_09515, partial [Acidimicrobiales bacterium]|nr:hypothetical protein [Acidimicrobiales bacterium]
VERARPSRLATDEEARGRDRPLGVTEGDEVLLDSLEAVVLADIADGAWRQAALTILRAVAAVNRVIEETRPWEISRQEARSGTIDPDLDVLLGWLAHAVEAIAAAVRPILPHGAGRLAGASRAFPRLS